MDIDRMNIYTRLRDHFIPSAVLDEIFRKEEDITTLESAFKALIDDGYTEDNAAKKIAELVFKETGIDPDYGLEEE
jgi:hypothetical protein|tara:strand:+ start:134 stop:361 length:228 start_codon:yes stop_codon:yes gene_type:complete